MKVGIGIGIGTCIFVGGLQVSGLVSAGASTASISAIGDEEIGLVSAGTSTATISSIGDDEIGLVSAGTSAATCTVQVVAYHWDASTNAADPVSSVTDSGAIGSTLTGAGSTRPAKGSINSRATLLFDNVDDIMTGDSTKANFRFLHGGTGPAAAGAEVGLTLLVVVNHTGHASNDTLVSTAGNAPTGSSIGMLLRAAPSTGQLQFFFANGSGTFSPNGSVPGTLTDNTTQVVTISANASTVDTFLDKVAGQSTNIAAPSNSDSSGVLCVGNQGSSNPMQGHICEVIVYNHKFNATVIGKIVDGLHAKWG